MAKQSRRLKSPPANRGKRIAPKEPTDYDSKPPAFSLEKLQPGDYCLTSLNQEHKAMFADAIFKRRTSSWKDVRNAPRHGIGTELIKKSSIKAAIPKFITDESETLLAMRYHGRCPMVGYRVRDIFYVLWFDHNFTLYDH